MWGNHLAYAATQGTLLISSWKCNFSIYLDIQVYHFYIQAITTLLCLLLVLYVLIPSIHSYFYLTTDLLKKLRFPALKSLLLSQFSTYRHRTWFIVERKQVRISNYLGLPIKFYILFLFLKLLILPPKNMRISKNSINLLLFFFKKR